MDEVLADITLLVRDYDEALAFYVGKLGFTLVEDTDQPEQGKRWVTIRPPGAPEGATTILLARAATPEQAAFVGNQAGGRLGARHRPAMAARLAPVPRHRRSFDKLRTGFARDHAAYTAARVTWVRPPVRQDYGTVAVFADLYGNL